MSRRAVVLDRLLTCFHSSLIGGVVGFLGGLAIALLFRPSLDPQNPLAGEWYSLAIAVSAVQGGLVGSLIGLSDGLLRATGIGYQPLAWALLGAVAGALAAMLLPKTSPEVTAYQSVASACLFAWLLVVFCHLTWRWRRSNQQPVSSHT